MILDRIKPKALLRRQAARLLARADRDRTPGNLERLERWRASGTRHAEALRKAEAVLNTSRLLSNVAAGLPADVATAQSEPRSSRIALAASITAAVAVLGVAYANIEGRREPASLEGIMLSTTVGEIRRVVLRDGSTVTLDTASTVRIEPVRGTRIAVVERGRVRFAISKGELPLTVKVGAATVQMDEGSVDVSSLPEGSHVDVIAGAVNILADDNFTIRKTVKALAAIDQPATATENIQPLHRPAVDWTSGRLSFDGARLADVVASANRYSRQQIVISDPRIADLQVTGVYEARDTAGLARNLASAFDLQLHRDGAQKLRLEARPPEH